MAARKKIVAVYSRHLLFSRRGDKSSWADVYYRYWGMKGGKRKKLMLAPCILARTDIDAMREQAKINPRLLSWERKFVARCDKAAKKNEDVVDSAPDAVLLVGVPEEYVTKKVVARVGRFLLRKAGVKEDVEFKYHDPKEVVGALSP